MAQSLDTTRPFVLGGVSFGGFVAQEVARHTSPLGLILISSCRSCIELPRLHRTIGWVSHVTPAWGISVAKRFVAHTRRLFGVVDPAQARLFDEMLYDTDPRFMRWCVRSLLAWRGAELRGIPTLHIHGERDRIIPLRGVRPDHVIPGAGHVVNMTHPREVNGIIQEWLGSVR